MRIYRGLQHTYTTKRSTFYFVRMLFFGSYENYTEILASNSLFFPLQYLFFYYNLKPARSIWINDDMRLENKTLIYFFRYCRCCCCSLNVHFISSFAFYYHCLWIDSYFIRFAHIFNSFGMTTFVRPNNIHKLLESINYAFAVWLDLCLYGCGWGCDVGRLWTFLSGTRLESTENVLFICQAYFSISIFHIFSEHPHTLNPSASSLFRFRVVIWQFSSDHSRNFILWKYCFEISFLGILLGSKWLLRGNVN